MRWNRCVQPRKRNALTAAWGIWALQLSGLCLPFLIHSLNAAEITLDGAKSGRVFEGLGAVSAGASGRLLIDYPEKQRAEILDYLFKPGFGASLQHLKVEIGGDINSTDGTEPGHERVQGEEDYHRGWEWWLIREARARNPNLILDALAWGAPGWIGGGNFYSQDMIDYLIRFLEGAKRVHGIEFDYLGIWNEQPYNADWIIQLRRALDEAGWTGVRLVAADQWDHPWTLAIDFAELPEFSAAVDVLGVHYPHGTGNDFAIALGKPLWASEDGTGGGNGFTPWQTARSLAKTYNRNYTNARITKTEIWSPVTSYYDDLPYNDSGLMRANTPWSGFYEVLPAIWITAHTTQFAQPGWKYLDGTASSDLPDGSSIVTLLSPDTRDLSVVIETIDAAAAQSIVLHATNGIPLKPLALWRTRDGDAFSFQGMIPVVGDGWKFTAEPDCVYTLTTTTGQSRGTSTVPAAAPFGLPYSESFESPSFAGLPFAFMDQAGAFEVVPDSEGHGKVLQQQMIEHGIEWHYPQAHPFTIVGDSAWTDCSVSVRVRIPETGEASLLGRVGAPLPRPAPPNAVVLAVFASKDAAEPMQFELRQAGFVMASGTLDLPGGPQDWHQLRLQFSGDQITAWIDGWIVADFTNTEPTRTTHGRVGVGSGWNMAEFDDLQVRRLPRNPPNLALKAEAITSSAWSAEFMPMFVNDGDPSTRWNAGPPTGAAEWIELEFPTPTEFNRITLAEYGSRIQGYVVESRDNAKRTVLARGTSLPAGGNLPLPTTVSRHVRLTITAMSDPVSLYEFRVYRAPTDAPSIRISEWMLHNTSAVRDPRDGRYHPWFELWNTGTTPAELGGYLMSNDSSLSTASEFPAGTVLQPGERRIVWCGLSSQVPASPASPPVLSVPWIPQEQQTLGLYTADGIPLFEVDLGRQAPNQSSGIPDSGSPLILDLYRATPGGPNPSLEALPVGRELAPYQFRLPFRGTPFTAHTVLEADSPGSAVWKPVQTVISDADGVFQVWVDALEFDNRFFRAEQR